MPTLTGVEIAAMVREVTEDEVAFYREHGWVKLPGLIAPELAEELRRVGEERHALDAELEPAERRAHHCLALNADAEPYPSFVLSEVMGRSAQRLIDRTRLAYDDVPALYRMDDFVFRPPTEPEETRQGWHQDSPEHGTDRMGEMKFWIALHDITAERGPMRFVDRSHRDGPLGSVLNDDYALHEHYRDLLDVYPRLAERITPPMEYRIGDATAHDGYTVHGSLPNRTDGPRLSHIIEYAPADTRFWNASVGNEGSKRTMLADREQHPTVFPRESAQ
jgi:hypothetical protein